MKQLPREIEQAIDKILKEVWWWILNEILVYHSIKRNLKPYLSLPQEQEAKPQKRTAYDNSEYTTAMAD